ncbi:glucose-6-phosphate dehydrogenase [Maricurvus nonylphenolicus]|uniref:glucose-6-phosphate dehydrogenase n=1 Tax=Maricurvus nonylphenolicus TaxID=1008307 RepID=UPI0036F425F8
MTQEFDIVIFGGLGDLSLRKLLPALYRSELAGHLHPEARIFLLARTINDQQKLLAKINKWLTNQLKENECPEEKWQSFANRIQFCSLDITKIDERWQGLSECLAQHPERDRVFYLSLPPSLYGTTCENLNNHNMISAQSRVVLEKPLGYDQESANDINSQVGRFFPEDAIFRIDHYLGKETVQNLMALRFANAMFEPLWNGRHIDHVQISISEEVGLEGRTAFYDQAGAMRDMVQNHILQLLCLVAMEPPNQLQANSIRTEKLKVLQALRPINGFEVQSHTVRGQYVEGLMRGKSVPGYLDELGSDSNTETFVAIKAHIDNWRWAGVPFYLRTGKRLKERCAEIVINFKPVAHNVFDGSAGHLSSNQLVIRLQPDEGMQMKVMAKELNKFEMRLQEVPLNLSFADTFENIRSDAYQRLLLNVIENDLSLFAHRDEADLAWAWVDPIMNAWNKCGSPVLPYEAGSWGPDASAALLHSDKRSWHNGGKLQKAKAKRK